MSRYAMERKTINDAVENGGLLVVAQWEAREGEADKVAAILDRFLPEAQREDGAKLFLISRSRENTAQFLFYELFRDEAAFKAHQESAHFRTYIAGQALPLLARNTRCCEPARPAHPASRCEPSQEPVPHFDRDRSEAPQRTPRWRVGPHQQPARQPFDRIFA